MIYSIIWGKETNATAQLMYDLCQNYYFITYLAIIHCSLIILLTIDWITDFNLLRQQNLQNIKQFYIIVLKVMESGTILHLALLKKLANHYPQGELTDKFSDFKKNKNVISTKNISINDSTTQETFQKYATSNTCRKIEKPSTSKPASSFRLRSNKQITKNSSQNCINADLSGWEVSDENNNIDYCQKIKENKSLTTYGELQTRLTPSKQQIDKKTKRDLLRCLFFVRKTQALAPRTMNHTSKNMDESKSQREMIKITYFNTLRDKENEEPITMALRWEHKLAAMPSRSYRKNSMMSKVKRFNLSREEVQNYFL